MRSLLVVVQDMEWKEHPVLLRAAVPMVILALAGCSPPAARETVRADEEIVPAQPAASARQNSSAGRHNTAAADPAKPPVRALDATMPEAIRGAWRLNDLGRVPTREDCATETPNIGKVLNVRANGFSIFEEGGRILQVHARTDETIEATFDTTYADTPTRARKRFALRPGPALAVLDSEEGGTLSYSRCPADPA